MPKTVDCPIARWPGQVTFKDPLPLADCVKLERAIRVVEALDYEPTRSEADELLLPAVLACVERFDLGNGFTVDPFPGSPKASSARLVAWLITQVIKIYRDEGESEVPLA